MRTRARSAAFVLATVLATFTLMASIAAPSYAQTITEDLPANEDGELVAPPPPDYQVDNNGFIIIGGDVVMPCSEVTGTPEVRACEAVGFDTAASASDTTLPDTGGLALSLPLLLVVGVALVASHLLVQHRRRLL
jgi:hypothetical protein